ncbi:sensor histidine kinase [Solirubrobacter soli]|uniref:sensor histidine kinase n=1 Tax=Solirubrobacter soli TaxID=363832 RepID=UPI0003FBA9E2|nr:histidine kinase [Solirubrobacter soli]
MRSPVAQFALSGLLFVVVVAVVGVLAVRHISRDEALFDAKQLTELAGNAVVAPAIEPGVLREDPAALARLDGVVRRNVLRDPVVRVKLWDESGRVVYSDEPRLIGKRYTLEPDERELFRHPGVHADLSDLTRPENRFERGEGPLREVYLGIRGPGGEHLLFETYLREGAIAAETHRVWRDVIPIVVGVLLALWLVQIPLGARLSRRLQRAQHQAVTASEHERRRLARDLHDGVVQDLVAVSLTLGAAQEHETGAEVRKAIRRLRTLSVELYPEDLHRQGLAGALSDLLAPLQLETKLEIADGLQLGRDTEALFYRTAHEALRNVAAHANAQSVTVRVTERTLEVVDDGQGFAAPTDDRPHLGLRLLDDLAREHGGALEIRSTPGRGTSILLKL